MKPTNFKQTCKYNKIMTSKEKADELAEEFLTFHQEGSKVYHIKIREAIAFAYNKCQEDMDKKYTEEDMGKLWQYVIDGAKSILLGNVVTIGKFEDYINSLNKQDNDK